MPQLHMVSEAEKQNNLLLLFAFWPPALENAAGTAAGIAGSAAPTRPCAAPAPQSAEARQWHPHAPPLLWLERRYLAWKTATTQLNIWGWGGGCLILRRVGAVL